MEQSSRAVAGPLECTVRRVAEAWRAWRRRRYWTQARQIEHLRTMLLADHRWLAADKTADALTERYLAALTPDWYARQHEDTARLRSRLGLVPPQGYDPGPGPEPCKHRDEPRGCYRVHALVNDGPWPGMSEAFDAHMGAACWVDLAYRQEAATWAAAWKASKRAEQPPRDAVQQAIEALQLAVRQNSHDMLLTGEELRQCEAALATLKGQR